MKPETIKTIWRYLITITILLIVSLAFLMIVYKLDFKLENISNSLFVVNISVFSITLIMHTGASRVFIPVTYTFKVWFKNKSTKALYPSYHDYYEENEKTHIKRKDHIIWSTIFLIIVSALLGVISVNI